MAALKENLVKQSIKSALSGTDSKLSQEFDYLLDGELFKDFSLVNECECLHHTSIAAGITPSRQARLAIFSILDDMIKKNIIKTKK
ncbi:hypothetical protein IJ596_06715 [bacterium]|nr:hypothetical protein [bacterium]